MGMASNRSRSTNSRFRVSKLKRIKTRFLKPKSSLPQLQRRCELKDEAATASNPAAIGACADFSTAACCHFNSSSIHMNGLCTANF
jgi:hypothetical protein